ncbi:bleomycin resistance protein [Verticiella sediminum]|uniref:Bleomycin resistance protein n=1 Tax=Verticiella sediminum TaxID=1247510 RepID=A0A556AQ12_9BURK|nr:VOC family protein [Verticiella sediminum]TSH94991.1 bleomycin resistance protein [Verticiella sediminum]
MKLANLNLFAQDIAALCAFYQALFGFRELAERRTGIYRCLDAGGVELGFNATTAYPLLALADRQRDNARPAVTAYPTFLADTPAEVDAHAARCASLGGRVVKAPYRTHYQAHQVVLADPEHNIFRIQSPDQGAAESPA